MQRERLKRPRRESNPHLRFRKPLFYPLNYGDNEIFDLRFSIADSKPKEIRSRLDREPAIELFVCANP